MKSHPFTVIDCDQRSSDWYAARCGRVTGSGAAAMLAKLKNGGYAAARTTYLNQIVAERITGVSGDGDGFQNADMRRGLEVEPDARSAYEAATGLMIETTGFIAHRDLMAGCSLDGHIADYVGIVEFKVPRSSTHYDYISKGVVPEEYLPQVRHNLFVTGAKWCEFVSFDPRFPPESRLFTVRLTADQAKLGDYELELRAFLAQVQLSINHFTGGKGS